MTIWPSRSPVGMTICASPGRRSLADLDELVIGRRSGPSLCPGEPWRGGNQVAFGRPAVAGTLLAILCACAWTWPRGSGVVALIGMAPATLEVKDPSPGDIVEKVAIMGDDQHGTGIFAGAFRARGRSDRGGWSVRRAAGDRSGAAEVG